LGNEEISVRVIHAGVGGINNSDVVLAAASDAIILGFNVRPDPSSENMAQREGIEIKTYRIIYEMVNEVKAALEGLLDPEQKEVTQGWAEVRKVFVAPKVGAVAGCMVTDGKVSRTAKARLVRNGAIVFEGGLGSLKRFKDDVKDVEKGLNAGFPGQLQRSQSGGPTRVLRDRKSGSETRVALLCMVVEFSGSTFFSFGKFPIMCWRISRRKRGF
jgi:translation initiation factor IF-2